MSEIKQFVLDLNREANHLIEDELMTVKNVVGLQALEGVTAMMPVLTGRARGNTIVSIASESHTYSDVTDKTGTATIAAGKAVMASDKDPFAPIYIQNNLPYIEVLEGGDHSAKAPNGMFGVTYHRLQVQFT